MSSRLFSIGAAALVAFANVGFVAAAVLIAHGLFPAQQPPVASGATLTVRVGPGTDQRLKVSPVTFLSRSGTNPGEGSKSMCGLVITAPGHPPQGVITVGTGATEATPSCNAVLALGAVPSPPGEKTRRIGVIHAVSSRNAANGRAAVIVRSDAQGRWIVDDDATARVDTMTNYTITEIRRRLR